MNYTRAFSGFSVKDGNEAKTFYEDVLGLAVAESPEGLDVTLPGGSKLFMYPKESHEPATFTILNLVVESIDAAVEELTGRGVEFLQYDNLPAQQDDKRILRGKAAGYGPDIAWLTDPSGNILGIIEE